MKFLFVIAMLFASFQASAASTCAPLVGTCQYYSCLSKGMNCKATDYTETLALPYCTAFNEDLAQYSKKAQAFILRVEACLQKKIEVKITNKTTCTDLGQDAPYQHTQCYSSQGFCTLPVVDQLRIAHLVMGVFFSAPGDFGPTFLEVGAHCTGEVL